MIVGVADFHQSVGAVSVIKIQPHVVRGRILIHPGAMAFKPHHLRTQPEHRQVDLMRSAVDQRPPFQHPVRPPLLDDRLASGVQGIFTVTVPIVDQPQGADLTNGAAPHQFPDLQGAGTEPVTEGRLQRGAGLLHGGNHPFPFGPIGRERFLAEDRQTIPGRIQHILTVTGRRRSNRNGLDPRSKKGVRISIGMRDLVLIPDPSQIRGIRIQHSVQAQILDRLNGWQMPVARHRSTAD